MKITIEFDTLEEMLQHVSLAGSIRTSTADTKAREQAPVAEPEKAQEPEREPVKKDTPAEKAPETAAQSPAEGKTPTEEDRVSVRKALAKLNKLTGKNVAREILEGMGFDKLTEVPLDRLAELMEKAKEAYADAQ